MSKKLKLIAVTVGIILSQSALADNSGWYIGGKLGTSFINASDQSYDYKDIGAYSNWSMEDKTKSGFNVGMQIGYDFAPQYNANVRLELDSTYRPEVKITSPIKAPNPTSWNAIITKAAIYTHMLNAYFDIETGTDFTPYVSAGLGVSIIDAKFNNTGLLNTAKTETNFAWAVGAGVAYSLTQNLDLDLSYRYLDAGKVTATDNFFAATVTEREEMSAKFISHDVTLGLRYSF